MTPPPKPPRRTAYLIADLIVTLLLLTAATWLVLHGLVSMHQARPMPTLVLWLLIYIVFVGNGFALYYKIDYFRMALARSRRYWRRTDRKEQP